jgi:hypothetical protein
MPRRAKTTALSLGLATAGAAAAWLATGFLDGPWGMLPGGGFHGPGAPCESARWERFATLREVEVEVRPESPRSVTTWSVVWNGELYLPADFLTPWKRWPHQVLEDDRIRLRVGAEIFTCRAERVGDEELIERLRHAAGTKYDLRPDGRAASAEVWWFKALPR